MTYEEYLDDLLGKASARAAQYDAQRQGQANSSIQQVQNMYDTMDRAAVTQYHQSAKETEKSYREAYDANAVSELTSRRRAEEAIAGSNLANSGLNNTQQTAISLARSRADAQVTQRKRAAVDAIMRELDGVRAQYRAEAAEKTAAIQNEADADKSAYWTRQQETAQDQAFDMYRDEQDRAFERYRFEQEQAYKAMELAYKYNNDSVNGGESYAQIKLDAIDLAKYDSQKAAIEWIEQLYAEGSISSEQRTDLRDAIGARETQPMGDSHLVAYTMRIYLTEGKKGAQSYLSELHNAGVISYQKYTDMCTALDAIARDDAARRTKS